MNNKEICMEELIEILTQHENGDISIKIFSINGNELATNISQYIVSIRDRCIKIHDKDMTVSGAVINLRNSIKKISICILDMTYIRISYNDEQMELIIR